MVLGDDLLSKANFKIGEEFEVYQDVDFKDMQLLKFKIKINKS